MSDKIKHNKINNMAKYEVDEVYKPARMVYYAMALLAMLLYYTPFSGGNYTTNAIWHTALSVFCVFFVSFVAVMINLLFYVFSKKEVTIIKQINRVERANARLYVAIGLMFISAAMITVFFIGLLIKNFNPSFFSSSICVASCFVIAALAGVRVGGKILDIWFEFYLHVIWILALRDIKRGRLKSNITKDIEKNQRDLDK